MCGSLAHYGSAGTHHKPHLGSLLCLCLGCLRGRVVLREKGGMEPLMDTLSSANFRDDERCTRCTARMATLFVVQHVALKLCAGCSTVVLGQIEYAVDDFPEWNGDLPCWYRARRSLMP